MADGEMVVDELTTDPLEALQELFTWAGRIPEAIPFDGMNGVTLYHDDGDGWISWPPHRTEMLDQGPAVARELGFLVAPTATGFSAAIPFTRKLGNGRRRKIDSTFTFVTVDRTDLGGMDVVDMRSFDSLPADEETARECGWRFEAFERDGIEHIRYAYNKEPLGS